MPRGIVAGGVGALLVATGATVAVVCASGSSTPKPPPGRIALPGAPAPNGSIAGVGMGGKLHYDGHCVYLDFASPLGTRKVSVVWTPGWTFEPSTGLLYDPKGRVSGKSGEVFQGGGLVLSEQREPGPVPEGACITSGSAETFHMLDVEVDPFLTKRHPQD